jgi:hypothetical protein
MRHPTLTATLNRPIDLAGAAGDEYIGGGSADYQTAGSPARACAAGAVASSIGFSERASATGGGEGWMVWPAARPLVNLGQGRGRVAAKSFAATAACRQGQCVV